MSSHQACVDSKLLLVKLPLPAILHKCKVFILVSTHSTSLLLLKSFPDMLLATSLFQTENSSQFCLLIHAATYS